MKKEKNKVKKVEDKSREPFPPENTPTPPQVMNPSKEPPKGESPSGKSPSGRKDESHSHSSAESREKKKLLGESPIDIDDETTI
jgi:hypothetical protein